jgi:pimeloyl-ACP methyl ester carboxylesterase
MRERMDMVRAYGAERYVAHVRATIARPDRHHLLIGDRPTLVVGGSHDSLFTPDTLAAWAGRIPGARHVTVAGAGHLVPMEQPAALSQALRTWMHAA